MQTNQDSTHTPFIAAEQTKRSSRTSVIPNFIRIGDQLIQIALYENIYVEDDVIRFIGHKTDDIDITFDDSDDAETAFNEISEALAKAGALPLTTSVTPCVG